MHRMGRSVTWATALRFAALGFGVLGLGLIAGCAGSEAVEDDSSGAARRQAEQGQAGQASQASSDDSLADSAEAAARQLEAAMARTQADPQADAGQRVEWTETWPGESQSEADEAPAPAPADADEPADADASSASDVPEPADPSTEHESSPASQPEPATPQDLLASLLEHVRAADEPALRRALTAATLRAAMGDASLDPHVQQPLSYSHRRTVERYHRVLLSMLGQLGESDAAFDRAALFERLDAMFEHEPVQIRKLALCREVSGYGIYEPFERQTFLAGQRQRVILYVELDHFRAEPIAGDRYEVKLQQQVVLYNESDGLAVWRHDPVQITDVSRNRRRDFFVVQLITLPERLNVGNYRLKVRLTDEHGGSIDEITTPIQLVADEKLLAGGRDD